MLNLKEKQLLSVCLSRKKLQHHQVSNVIIVINVYNSRSLQHRAESPTPSLLSVKSDWSMGQAPNFSDEPGPPHTYVDPPVQYM